MTVVQNIILELKALDESYVPIKGRDAFLRYPDNNLYLDMGKGWLKFGNFMPKYRYAKPDRFGNRYLGAEFFDLKVDEASLKEQDVYLCDYRNGVFSGYWRVIDVNYKIDTNEKPIAVELTCEEATEAQAKGEFFAVEQQRKLEQLAETKRRQESFQASRIGNQITNS